MVCNFKKKFTSKIAELNISPNSILIKDKKIHDKLISEVSIAKNKTKKTAADYRRIQRFDVLTIEKVNKLVHSIESKLDNVGINVKYYAHNENFFDIIKAAHIETGHGLLHKIHDTLKTEYVNVTRAFFYHFM